ncbi:hypothetical protein ACFL36_03570 [Thermodesulfobacteriota bacterium]
METKFQNSLPPLIVVVKKKRSVIQTFFPTTTYTSRKVFMKSGVIAKQLAKF